VIARFRTWYRRRRRHPFDWHAELPDMRGPSHVRVIMPMGAAREVDDV
jgi:hypothetical protein